jgi:Ca-activated chloride channel family protein
MQDRLIFYILLIGGFLVAWLYFCLARYRKKQESFYVEPRLVPKRLLKRSPLGFFFRAFCLLGTWVCLGLSLMEPSISSTNVLAKPQIALDQVEFLIDVSRSMDCLDTPSGASRLERAKEIVSQIVSKMSGVNITLRAFAGDSAQVVPPTEDYVYFQTSLEQLSLDDVPLLGTDFRDLFHTLKQEKEKSPHALKTLAILLTDGEDTTRAKQEEAIYEQIASLKKRFIVVALGTEKGAYIPNFQYEGQKILSRMHHAFLEKLATKAQGLLYDDNSASFVAITDAITLDIALKQQPQKKLVSIETSSLRLPLLLALVFLVIACIIPQTKPLLILAFFSCSQMAAASVQDSVDRSLLFAQASRDDLAINELGKLLARPLSSDERDIVFYDMGTLLAKTGRYSEALEYFRQVEARTSPILFEQLAYNGALCSIKIANTLQSSAQIAKYLEEAKDFASRSKETKRQLQKELKALEQKKKLASLKERLEKEPPKEIMALFIAYLERSIKKISETQNFRDFWRQNEPIFDVYAGQFSAKEVQSLSSQIKQQAHIPDPAKVQSKMKDLITLLQSKKALELLQTKSPEYQEIILQKTSIQRLQEMVQDDMSLEKREKEMKHPQIEEGEKPW